MKTTIIEDIKRDYIKETHILNFVEFLFERMSIDKELELNILFSDDERIKNLNREFKNKDDATDILSFYGYDGDILGDIIISIETMEKEAKQENKDILDYALFLIAHGFLHLTGYTHETMEKYNEMIELQNRLIKEWKNAQRD